ncbi:hypothetical protein FB446DRAFT_707943 [Lentinula raphanica]|nr:hypothetical protein FB446DRAFT_707943 [Lentinula raphanica]
MVYFKFYNLLTILLAARSTSVLSAPLVLDGVGSGLDEGLEPCPTGLAEAFPSTSGHPTFSSHPMMLVTRALESGPGGSSAQAEWAGLTENEVQMVYQYLDLAPKAANILTVRKVVGVAKEKRISEDMLKKILELFSKKHLGNEDVNELNNLMEMMSI